MDSGEAASDWDGIVEMIKRMLEKGQGVKLAAPGEKLAAEASVKQ